jgi:hypothetical protein
MVNDQQPKKQYKPIFNRTYLKYLGFVVAIVIILLSKKAPTPLDQPQAVTAINPVLHVLKAEDLAQQRLFLSFNTSPALSSQHKIERELAYQALHKATKTSSVVFAALWTFDRLELELRWSPDQKLDIKQTLHTFFTDSTNNINDQDRKIITASQYLEDQADDTVLLNALEQRIAYNLATPTPLSQILSITPSALLITDEDSSQQQLVQVEQQLLAMFPRAPIELPESIDYQQSTSTLYTNSSEHKLLIASQIKMQTNLQSSIDLLSHFMLSDILSSQQTQFGFDFRLVRKPIYYNGYQAIILTTNNAMPEQLKAQLLATIDIDVIDKRLAKIKERLLDAYSDLIDNQDRLFSLYSKKLFYGFETQSKSLYEEQLDSISDEQIMQQLQYLLGDQTTSIYLKPNL